MYKSESFVLFMTKDAFQILSSSFMQQADKEATVFLLLFLYPSSNREVQGFEAALGSSYL